VSFVHKCRPFCILSKISFLVHFRHLSEIKICVWNFHFCQKKSIFAQTFSKHSDFYPQMQKNPTRIILVLEPLKFRWSKKSFWPNIFWHLYSECQNIFVQKLFINFRKGLKYRNFAISIFSVCSRIAWQAHSKYYFLQFLSTETKINKSPKKSNIII